MNGTGIRPSEFWALVDFYESTNGNNWFINDGWHFMNDTSLLYNDSNEYMKQICVDFVPYMLNCTLVNKTMDSYSIVSIVSTGNNLNGTFPTSLTNLSNLEIFSLEFEPYLEGSLSCNLYNWRKLTQVGLLMVTGVSFEFSNELCQQSWQLKQLNKFSLNQINLISGYLPDCLADIESLTYFQGLCFFLCPFEVSFCLFVCVFFCTRILLVWSSLNLNGTLPPGLFTLQNLTYLVISNNNDNYESLVI